MEVHQVLWKLSSMGVEAGPGGAATLAGLQYAMSTNPRCLNLTPESIFVLLSAEAPRAYNLTLDIKASDSISLAQALFASTQRTLGSPKPVVQVKRPSQNTSRPGSPTGALKHTG